MAKKKHPKPRPKPHNPIGGPKPPPKLSAPQGMLRIITHKPKMDLTISMGQGPAMITSGFGGWASVARPDDIAFTEWAGSEPIRQDIPLMLDGWSDKRSIAPQLEALQRLGREVGYGDGVPPIFRAIGPIYHSGDFWVLEDMEYGEAIRHENGALLRQPLVLHVIEFIDADTIKIRRRRRKRRTKGESKWGAGGAAAPRVYTTHKGDTLMRITVHFFGSREPWKMIRDLNPKKAPRDPHKVMPHGIKLLLPKGW